ncbi:MAG: hypothetical protein B0D91_04750 [Oceanospirillales bacterium LUC14_002_19_P2]|nr:MAG: hypothetical protein B0D91_04750 [Oceanospirillales bacterium LUC14_002_19_P2]
MSRHVVDTNVLIVASGEHPDSPFSSDRHPVEDVGEAEKVLEWLMDFELNGGRMVSDDDYEIFGEYEKKLTEQDYGLMVRRTKFDRNEIDFVGLEWEVDPANPDKVAVIPEPLKDVVQDLADRKMIAACLSASDERMDCTIVNACDTDWYDWQTKLEEAGVEVDQLIEEWSRKKWKAHHDR